MKHFYDQLNHVLNRVADYKTYLYDIMYIFIHLIDSLSDIPLLRKNYLYKHLPFEGDVTSCMKLDNLEKDYQVSCDGYYKLSHFILLL